MTQPEDQLLVDVVPLMRMPSTQRGLFTYRVPESLAPRCIRGAFVRIPFRRRRLWGVVVARPAVTMFSRPLKHGDTRIREILGVRSDLTLTNEEVAAVERTAALFHASLATTAYLTLPHPTSVVEKKLQVSLSGLKRSTSLSLHSHFRAKMRMTVRGASPPSAQEWASQFLQSRGTTVAVYRSHPQRVEALRALASELIQRQRSLLVITPHRAWLSPLADTLTGTAPVILLDRAEGRIAQWEAALAARAQPSVIIATRAGAFTAPPFLGAIAIDDADDDDLKQYDADPRYDARTVALSIATARGIPLLQLSAAPRVVDWATAMRRIELGPPPSPPTIIDLRTHWRSRGRGFLTTELTDAVTQCLERKRPAVILHNRRGRMGQLTCRDCGHVPRCDQCNQPLAEHPEGACCHRCHTTMVPLTSCPSCGSSVLAGRGIGTIGIADALQRQFPSVRIARVDRDAPDPPPHDTEIIVGSERFLTSIAPAFAPPVRLLAILHAERFTRGDDIRGSERLLQSLSRARAWAQTWNCQFIIQTSDPDHPAIRTLSGELSAFYREELAERKILRYPPFSRLVRYDAHGPDATRDGVSLRRLLEREKSGTVLSVEGPYAFGIVRRKPLTSVLARFSPKADDRAIAAINASVPSQWSIDLDPIALHA